MQDLYEALGDRPATLCRELTKMHESYYRMPLGAMKEMLENKTLKGEMVLVIAGAQPGAASNPPAEDDLRQEVRNLLAQGVKSKTCLLYTSRCV